MFKIYRNLNGKLRFFSLLVILLISGQSAFGYLQTSLITSILSGISALEPSYETLNIALLFIYSLCAFVCSIFGQQIAVYVTNRFARDLRRNYFRKLMEMPIKDIETFSTASLITRATSDTTLFKDVFFSNVVFVARGLSLFIGGLVTALTINATLSSLLLLIIPAFLIIVGYHGVKAQPYFGKGRKLLDRTQEKMRESIIGARVVKSYNLEKTMFDSFDKVDENLMHNNARANGLILRVDPFVQALLNLSTIGIILIVGSLVAAGNADISLFATIVPFIQILLRVAIGMYIITFSIVQFTAARPSILRLVEIYDFQVSMHFPKVSAQKLEHGKITFQDVTFSYKEAEESLLKDIDFEIQAGEKVGIIGTTGGGKSTLLNLISRTYDVSSGKILLDGHDIKSYSEKELHNNIATSLQKSEILSGTIRENILMSKKLGDLQDIQEQEKGIWTSLEWAQAKNFVSSYEDQLNAPIEQRGANLSGGQKQRISIARTLAQNAKITIFDDSTSALDTITEAKVLKAIFDHMKTTLIIVAQRISTVQRMDKIIVLEHGEITGIGTHQELLKNNDLYQQIARTQLGNTEVNRMLGMK